MSAEAPSSEWITYEEFSRVDLRVAEVVAAERIPNADRLLKLTVRVGEEERTIVAGIAQHYAPEQMVGKRIIIVANLKPRKVFGVESQGMLLAAQEGERLALVELPEPIASGAKVS
ncbi:MAG: hypothetical protein KatS3mg115_1490 [Candidatus Poribacteria bacterium]|nr:MAG: hypothetical protein KatS3mg115_1490 [Candidatus Poribacteria bacterium]